MIVGQKFVWVVQPLDENLQPDGKHVELGSLEEFLVLSFEYRMMSGGQKTQLFMRLCEGASVYFATDRHEGDKAFMWLLSAQPET